MSIEKHLGMRGIELAEDNSIPKDQRTQKVFKRIISAVRAAEAEANDEIRESNQSLRVAQSQVIELQARVNLLESELRRYKVSERLQDIEKLTVADRQKLLEVA